MSSRFNTRYTEPIVELIRRRRSVRTYSSLPVPADVKKKIKSYFTQLNGPFKTKTRFELVEKRNNDIHKKVKLGTYGVIQGARSFIAAVVEKREHSLLQLGYIFEDLILYLTSLGLGTCWLAGTFNKKNFSQAVHVKPKEMLPIVSPVGYSSWIRSPIDILIKPLPALKMRRKWKYLFFSDDFTLPLQANAAGEYTLPLEMVRLAPSASNKQPWRIIKQNRLFHFYLEHDPMYASRYPYDIQKIDIGIAMFHFESTAIELGLKGRWIMEKPELKHTPGAIEYIISWAAE
jgi:nitroreductase